MTGLRILLARLLGLFSSSAGRDRELRAEIDAHIAEATDEYVRQGMTPEEGRHYGASPVRRHHSNRRSPSRSDAASRSSPRCVRTSSTPPYARPRAGLRDRRHPDACDWHSRQYDDLQRRQRHAVHAAAGRAPGTDRAGPRRASGRSGDRAPVREAHVTSSTQPCARTTRRSTALAAIKDVTVPISDTAQSARTEQHTGVARGGDRERDLLQHARRPRGPGTGLHPGRRRHTERPSGGRHQRPVVDEHTSMLTRGRSAASHI